MTSEVWISIGHTSKTWVSFSLSYEKLNKLEIARYTGNYALFYRYAVKITFFDEVSLTGIILETNPAILNHAQI